MSVKKPDSKSNPELDSGQNSKLTTCSYSRRKFIRMGIGALSAGGLFSLTPALASEKKIESTDPREIKAQTPSAGKSRVVIARNEKIWNGNAIDGELVRQLIFEAVRIISGKKNDDEAWHYFFRSYETVGLKLNCIAGRGLSQCPEVVRAICDGLESAGIRKSHIIIWDNSDRSLRTAGYHTTTATDAIQCFGNDHSGIGYDEELSEAGSVSTRVSRIASTLCDALINVPVLKDHDRAGVSISLKNYYGAILNPSKFHGNGCDPYIADLNTLPVFRKKTRLIVCDATTAQYHGGPGYSSQWAWRYSGILVSTDPVALDAVGHSIIEEKRREAGLNSLAEDGRPPRHIESAAHPSRALGTADLNKIEIVNIS